MKRFAIAVSVVVLAFGVAILAQIQTGNVEKELIKLENEWGDALIKHDPAPIDKMIADDFIGINDGNAYTKAELLEFIKSYKGEYTSLVADEWKARVYGDAAVVIARMTYKMQLEGKGIAGQQRFTDTWIRRDGRWQCAAGHNSTIAQK